MEQEWTVEIEETGVVEFEGDVMRVGGIDMLQWFRNEFRGEGQRTHIVIKAAPAPLRVTTLNPSRQAPA